MLEEYALNALDTALRPGVAYADARVVESADRSLSTKNGRAGTAAVSEQLGIGIRVIADGCWGFAAASDLSRAGVDTAVRLAISIARSGALAKHHNVLLAPEAACHSSWTSSCEVDPFRVPIEVQFAHLLDIDHELRRHKGITMAEGSMQFTRFGAHEKLTTLAQIELPTQETGHGTATSR